MRLRGRHLSLLARALVPAALVLVLGVAATSGGSKVALPGAGPGKLTFNPKLGSVLPTRAGKTIASVLCDGPSSRSVCRGTVTIVPRGATREELGPAPIAGRHVKLQDGDDGNFNLNLNARARHALANHFLAVTIRLRQHNDGPTRTRPAIVAPEKN